MFDLNGWIVGDGGVILKLEDDGAAWDEYPSPTNNTLYGVYMLDRYNGWAVGEAGVIIRTKDGARWESLAHRGGMKVVPGGYRPRSAPARRRGQPMAPQHWILNAPALKQSILRRHRPTNRSPRWWCRGRRDRR